MLLRPGKMIILLAIPFLLIVIRSSPLWGQRAVFTLKVRNKAIMVKSLDFLGRTTYAEQIKSLIDKITGHNSLKWSDILYPT